MARLHQTRPPARPVSQLPPAASAAPAGDETQSSAPRGFVQRVSDGFSKMLSAMGGTATVEEASLEDEIAGTSAGGGTFWAKTSAWVHARPQEVAQARAQADVAKANAAQAAAIANANAAQTRADAQQGRR